MCAVQLVKKEKTKQNRTRWPIMRHTSPVWGSAEGAIWRHLRFTSSPDNLQVHLCSLAPWVLSDSVLGDVGGMTKRTPGERRCKGKTGRVESWKTKVRLIRVQLRGGVSAHGAPAGARTWRSTKKFFLFLNACSCSSILMCSYAGVMATGNPGNF